ncbi:MAG TPA: class I SAM-dependent methyltransferase [Solirubrobacteraceae bacterium]|jgi:tRNA (mo5U34)-methyltransferase|nr:class I SAM-dependent methyltransferase [Solirubrobacteraceae bacterium]
MSSLASPAAVAAVPIWYHTLELPGGVVTPGWFDLRAVADRLPWPDVRGKRCLDVATYDGFFAFELERRGAAEVVAIDIPDHEDWDWPAAARAAGGPTLATMAGEKGRGFEVAHAALGSRVRKQVLSTYHLAPDTIGEFDVVVCGSLMLHLRDPVRALEAIRSVCTGQFLSIEEISLPLTLALSRRPVAEMRFDERRCQWWVANLAGHRRMLEIAGFEVEVASGPFGEPFGPAHPAAGKRLPRSPRELGMRALRRAMTGEALGVPHAALLAHPRLQAPPIRL